MSPEDDCRSSCAAEREPVARRLVRPVADEDLVQRQERLPVVEPRLTIVRSSTSARPRATIARRSSGASGAWRHQDAVELRGFDGLTPITICPWRYLARLATRPSCPTATTTSVRLEEEASELGAIDPRPPPLGGDRRGDRVERRGPALVALRHLVERLPARLEEEARLRSSVPWRASSASYSLGTGHHDHARGARATRHGLTPASSLRACALEERGSSSGPRDRARRGSGARSCSSFPRARGPRGPAAPAAGSVAVDLHSGLLRRGRTSSRARSAVAFASPRTSTACGRRRPARRLGVGQRLDLPAFGLRLDALFDALASSVACALLVLPALRDELLLALRQLDLVLQLVLLDGPLLLHRRRGARTSPRRPPAGCCSRAGISQRRSSSAVGLHRRDAREHDLQAQRGEAGAAPRPLDLLADDVGALVEQRAAAARAPRAARPAPAPAL